MDGKLKDGRVGRLWMCKRKGGHVLGLAVQRHVGGGLIDELLLFDAPVNLLNLELVDGVVQLPDVFVLSEGEGTARITCRCCGVMREWIMGQAALERFLQNKKVNHHVWR